MKETLAPIDGAGRVVLPKVVRDELAIKPGDLLRVEVHGAGVTLTPNMARVGLIRKGKALVFSTIGRKSIGAKEIEAVLEGTRAERHDRIEAGIRHRRRGG